MDCNFCKFKLLKTEEIHRLYLSCLLRFPTDDEVDVYPPVTRDELIKSVEGQICILIKHYQGVSVDFTEFTLTPDIPEAIHFTEFLHEVYSLYLFKTPHRPDYVFAITLLKLYGGEEARLRLVEYIKNQNEYKYLNECLGCFLSWEGCNNFTSPMSSLRNILSAVSYPTPSTLRVRYYGPVGTSGYATVCRDILSSIYMSSVYMDLSFVPLSIENFTDDKVANGLTRYLCPAKTVDDFYSPDKLGVVDLVILHSVPDRWIPIVRREKRLNPRVVTVGVTVWETDAIPPQWTPHVRCVDRLTVPNTWNRDVFQRDVPRIDVTFLPHPVLPQTSGLLSSDTSDLPQSLQFDRSQSPYVFYNISEWSGRKGVEILIQAFVEEFSSLDNTVLFIKTHGSVSEDVGRQFLQAELSKKANPPTIILDYSRWDNSAIDYLHKIGDCFVTLTHSEGHGLGACHAALEGNHVIMSEYGGQTNYLQHIAWVPCSPTPAYLCSAFDGNHIKCLKQPCCRFFAYFLSAQQNWGEPDVLEAKQLMRTALEERKQGDIRTVDYLTKNFSSHAIGANFKEYLYNTFLHRQGTRVRCPRRGLEDTYLVPSKKLLPLKYFVKPTKIFKGKRVRVLVIGAGFLGNFGDDSYVVMHEQYLSDKYDLTVCNTTSYVDKSGKLVPLHLYTETTEIQPFDHLVIGGGGLINDGEVRSSIFRVYFPYCKKHNVPLSFVSVGFGYKAVEDETLRTLSAGASEVWSEILSYAESISVRSHADKEAVKEAIPRHRHHRIKVFADLVYGLPETVLSEEERQVTPKEDLLVYIPTNFLCMSFTDVALHLEEELMKNPSTRLVMIHTGGVEGQGDIPSDFVRRDEMLLRRLFPNVVTYPGRHFSGPLQREDVEIEDQTPEKVVRLLRRAKAVITGRYHGVVLARALKKPYWVGTCSLHKIQEEVGDNLDISSWREHYTFLQLTIDYTHRYGRQKDPSLWSSDDRNTTITDVVTNSLMSTGFVQNLSNQQLDSVKRDIFLKK